MYEFLVIPQHLIAIFRSKFFIRMTTGVEASPPTRVIQVTNVAKTATYEQLKTFFDFLGTIEEMKIYPTQ